MHKGIDMIDKAGSWESPDRPDLVWEELSTEHIITDEWIDFRKSTYRFPDGRVFEPYYSYSRRDYVVIVASDENGRFLCVRQFRQGIREVTTEFPAGCIERKDGSGYRSPDSPALTAAADGEKPFPITPSEALKAAKRELQEETGYVSDDWTYLLTVPSNATLGDNYACVYRAKNCRRVTEQHLDETEYLNMEIHTSEEIEHLIRIGKFQQAIHVMAWLLAQKAG